MNWWIDFKLILPLLREKTQIPLKGSKIVELVCIFSLEVTASSQLPQEGVLWVLGCSAAGVSPPAFQV